MIIPPILTTSLIHFLFKGWENVHFEVGGERVKRESRVPVQPPITKKLENESMKHKLIGSARVSSVCHVLTRSIVTAMT